MADLQELFARLSNGAGGSPNQQPQQQQQPRYQQPSVSSPLFSPSPNGPQPHHHSAIMSPNMSAANTPAPEHGAVSQQTPQQQSAQLLNLLRFNSQPGAGQARRVSQRTEAPEAPPMHDRIVSATDVATGFVGHRTPSQGHSVAASASAQAAPASVSSENPQDLLLRLLNHPKPAQSDERSSRASAAAFSSPVPSHKPEMVVDDLAQDLNDANLEHVSAAPAASSEAPSASPMRIFGAHLEAMPSRPAPVAPKFTYINPFDALEAASPRNRTPAPEAPKPHAPKVEILKPKHHTQPSTATHSSHPHETVAEAVSDLGEQISHQIEEALAEAEDKSTAQISKELDDMPDEDIVEIQKAVVELAIDVKEELEDENMTRELQKSIPKPLAAALQEVATEIAGGDVADDWETAEAEESLAKGEDQTVVVYRFPMRAFATIQVNEMPPRRPSFPPDLFMDVARLRKDFDQIDRSLVAASKNFIVYAQAKKGGFRIVRQENGIARFVFENHSERIFNIALCSSADDSQQSIESILGIGINGTVFWTSLDPAREDTFGENLDSQGLMLPPSPLQDDNTSGGQLKTRAKPSSRHPEFFAVGRGKSIHIVFPRVAAEYTRPKSRICHTEKYLKERSLKILTGKAGKDFTFSEDDTIVVSLDKAGRMRFWDIRSLTEPELGNPRAPARQVEVSETLLEFHTTTPNAKSWPTSVFFFDKDKPFTKGIALRYVMVGMKQNHSYQLWDLGLGKAVQEIHLPHGNESDAICSVAFHPRTGIMAVAHPTRNSIFFVHVSCPRYNLPALSQATYVARLANKGERGQAPLPPVNATAIMTSITEYSFASKGQIRSLHMLNEPVVSDVDNPENAALFELYVMHSKGVCDLRIRRSDLGWKKEGEPINPKEAEEEGVITISQLKPPQPAADEASSVGDVPPPKSVSDRSVRESVKKDSSNVSKQSMTPEAAMRASTLAKVESKQDAVRAAIINGGPEKAEKPEKKKKKKTPSEVTSQASASTRAPTSSYAQIAQSTPLPNSPAPLEPLAAIEVSKEPETEAPEWAKQLLIKHLKAPTAPAPTPAAVAPEFDGEKLEALVRTEISQGISRELDVLYKRIDEDKRVMNASSGAKQEAILRLVSSTLTENVEGVIKKMVDENMRNVLLPEMLAQTSSALEKSISGNLKAALGPQLAKEVPDAVSRSLKAPQLFQSLSDQVAKKVIGNVEPIMVAAVGSIVNPAILGLSNLIDKQIGEQLRQSHVERREDAARIAQLTDTVHTCLETIQSMASTQAELQTQVTKLQQTFGQPPVRAPVRSPPAPRAPVPQKTPEEQETEAISLLMSNGQVEEGTMQWLQSSRVGELFEEVFVHCNPTYLRRVGPLLALSTGAVVSDTLDRRLAERLVWLDAVFSNINPNVSQMEPSIMSSANQ
jgi:hypothetical protein